MTPRVDWRHPLNRGLCGWWLALPGRGLVWRDLASGADARTSHLPAPTPAGAGGRPGGVRSFAFAPAGQELVAPDRDRFDATSALTLLAWVQYDGRSGADQNFAKVISKGVQASAPYTRYALGLDNAAAGSQKVSFDLSIAGAQNTLLSGAALPVGRWVFLAATYDGAAMRVYVDTAASNSVAKTGDIDVDGLATSNDLHFGRFGGTNQNRWNGRIDDVRVYRRALSAGEVRAYFDLSRRGYPGLRVAPVPAGHGMAISSPPPPPPPPSAGGMLLRGAG